MNGLAEKLLSRLNIHRIETTSPNSGGITNCYFIDGKIPTLIDSGLAFNEAYDSIASTLRTKRRRMKDIGRIILTHGHADHRALAARIHEESGAEVLCHPLETERVVIPSARQERLSLIRSESVFRAMGVPEKLLPDLVNGPQTPSVTPRLDRVSVIGEGDEILFDRMRLKVLHTPGHSSGSICLYDNETGVIFTGDTLLPSTRITALLETDMLSEDPEYNSLKLHAESLQRLIHLDAKLVLPGHGPVFDEYVEIINAIMERHEKRRRHILRSLRSGRRTAYQIGRSVFLLMADENLYLALSEIIGNIGIMIEQGMIARQTKDKITYYEKA